MAFCEHMHGWLVHRQQLCAQLLLQTIVQVACVSTHMAVFKTQMSSVGAAIQLQAWSVLVLPPFWNQVWRTTSIQAGADKLDCTQKLTGCRACFR